jgi:hypothetical protein
MEGSERKRILGESGGSYWTEDRQEVRNRGPNGRWVCEENSGGEPGKGSPPAGM